MKLSHLIMSTASLLVAGASYSVALAGNTPTPPAKPGYEDTIKQAETKDGICAKGREAADPDCKE
jgi:hypothetical protein